MAFESVKVQLQIGGGAAVATWRQDATVGSIMTCSLSDTTGITAFHWWLMGRPESSGAGGGGPEPLDLGTAATATFTIDVKGTYIVWCQVNSGQPNATIIRGGCAYLETITDPSGRPLRLLGPQETDEDLADTMVAQGWMKMLNRWLRKVAAGGGGGGFPGYYDLPPEPVGVSHPGTSELVSRGNHSHASVVPISEQKSYLYTAKKAAAVSLDMGQVTCLYTGSIMCAPTLFGEFTEGPPGTFVRNFHGPLESSKIDGVDVDAFNHSGVSSMLGRTLLCTIPPDLVAPLIPSDQELSGPYILDDVGGHWENYGLPGQEFVLTYVTLRRHPDFDQSAEFVTDMSFQVQTGNVYGTEYAQLTTAGPIVLGTTDLDWAFTEANPNPPVADSYPLLTAAQLSQASTETVEAEAVINSASGLTTLLVVAVSPDFRTLVGTPGLATIPAGQFVADCLAKVSTAATGETKLNFRILKDTGSSFVELFNFDTTSVTSPAYAAKQVAGAITLQDIAGCRLVLHLRAQTTSATYVTVTVIVNDPSHSCRLTFPVEFATLEAFTLAGTYDNGSAGPDQTMTVSTLKGGGVVVDASTAAVTADGATLTIQQSATWEVPALIERAGAIVSPAILRFSKARGTLASPEDIQANDGLGWLEFSGQIGGVRSLLSRINVLCTAVGAGPVATTAIEFQGTYLGDMAALWRMSANGAGNGMLVGYGNPVIQPETNAQGQLGSVSSTWGSLNVQTAHIYTNGAIGTPTIGAADHTLAFSNNASFPSSPTNQIYLGSVDWTPNGVLYEAALAVQAEAVPWTEMAAEDFTVGIPFVYNGVNYFILARNMTPG